jgi:hypothetical protein
MTFNPYANLRMVRNFAAVVAVLTLGDLTANEPASQPFSRAAAAKIIAEARKIVNPEGIERLEKVRVGGFDQWVSVRGTDKRNPVLLLIHGGPGYVSMPMS